MEILHVVPSYKPAYIYGGPIESIAKLCEGLVTAGHTVDVYTTTANGPSELPLTPNERKIVDGVSVTYFSRITRDPTHISPPLWRALYKNCRKYDVVHIHSWWNFLVIVAAMICHRKKVKTVISPRGMLSQYILTVTNSSAKQLLHKMAGENALRKSYFHATSEAEYKECMQLIPKWKGFILPNLITLPPLKMLKTKNNAFTLLFLSRIHPKKGIELLLQALQQCKSVVLKIAGDGEEKYISDLKQQAKDLGIDERIQWLGWLNREKKFEELMKADLFVLTSYNENFANVVIESLYVGTPVLISDKVGLASFVENENMGWVTELTVDKIAKKILQISHSELALEKIQNTSRQVILRDFSEPVLIEQYVNEYKKLIEKN